MERVIKVFRTREGNLIKHTTSATILGELVKELGLKPDNERIMIKETKVTLEDDLAQLPEGEFTLFVSQKKIKSGVDYESMKYNDLRKLAKDSLPEGTSVPSKKDEIIAALVANDSSKGLPKTAKLKATKEAKGKVAMEAKKEGFQFNKSTEDKIANLIQAVVLIGNGLNELLAIDDLPLIDFSFIDKDVKDLPLEVKNEVVLSPEERARIEEQQEIEALKRESSMMGL